MRQKLLTFIVLLSTLSVFLFIGIWIQFISSPLNTHTIQSSSFRYQLYSGTTLHAFADDLYKRGFLHHPRYFMLLATLRGSAHELKAGIYSIPNGTTPYQLLNQVTSGKGLLYHVFTIVPGWSFHQLRTALNNNSAIQHQTLLLNDDDIMNALGVTGLSPEGEFYPDSYYFTEGASDIKLLSRAFKRLQEKLQEAWLTRAPDLPFTLPYQVLIAASLVEKEARLNAEQPVIAGVLLNRLQKKMPLQFDPTVVYGLGTEFTGTLRKQDLTWQSPYNTYLHQGLPPTPIAIPSMNAINAVLHPVIHHYLYFVATPDGGHQFSQTLEEHHLAVMMAKPRSDFFNYVLLQSYLQHSILFQKVS